MWPQDLAESKYRILPPLYRSKTERKATKSNYAYRLRWENCKKLGHNRIISRYVHIKSQTSSLFHVQKSYIRSLTLVVRQQKVAETPTELLHDDLLHRNLCLLLLLTQNRFSFELQYIGFQQLTFHVHVVQTTPSFRIISFQINPAPYLHPPAAFGHAIWERSTTRKA